ncbi:TlpA disulfide reductase family protein [uncultured Flavobacterium sp.]|uniref:TlpA disulfide reductase family protein n=1 Tax=uncultured Flavobacterium sp. TaxID=165435 RepID=UPI0030ED5BAA|tara:strand:- start:41879 stop:43003 length:1125 start_codon:yes stop_codon:yes gene_type:complete
MKKIALLVFAALTVISCKKDGYEITGLAKGVENGKKVYLETQNETGPVTLDTAVVESEKFKFDGKLKEGVELAFVRIETLNGSVPLVLENGDISVEFNKDTIQNSKIGGTKNNDKFQLYNNESQVIYKKMMKFQEVNQQKMSDAQQTQDTATVSVLMKEYNKFQDDMNVQSKAFITKNPDAFISALLLENFLMRSYLTPEEVKGYYEKLDKSIVDTKSGKNIKKMIDALTSVNIGSVAPDFSAPSPDGKMISLKESMGKVTLIDFWASWCGPCRQENPNVVAMYNELHEKGLNIIGVSLDKEGESQKWKDAIAKDGLTWNHISNLKHWKEPIAEQYNVKSIPATFLLDASGKIVAKDLRGEELKAKVKELLGVQ